jgi:hypothetical protein
LARQPAFGALYHHQPTTSSFRGEKQTFVSLRGGKRISETIFHLSAGLQFCQEAGVEKQKEAARASFRKLNLLRAAGTSP